LKKESKKLTKNRRNVAVELDLHFLLRTTNILKPSLHSIHSHQDLSHSHQNTTSSQTFSYRKLAQTFTEPSKPQPKNRRDFHQLISRSFSITSIHFNPKFIPHSISFSLFKNFNLHSDDKRTDLRTDDCQELKSLRFSLFRNLKRAS
jgi:hypothetical protein